MANYQYYEDFKLIDKETGIEKRLSDFGGIVYNPNNDSITRNMLPDPEHITSKNENQDGERYIKTLYGTRIIEVPVYFSEDLGAGELFELNRWLGKKRQQTFQWVNDDERKEIDVIYKEGFDMDILFGDKFNGLTTLSFIAHNPYWTIRDERPMIFRDIKQGNELKVKNKGNTECYPLIEVTPETGSTTIKLQINELSVTLKDLNKPIYIDCEKERVYEIVNGVKVATLDKFESNKYCEFPYFKTEISNRIRVIQGNIKSMKITFNTRII